MNKFQKECHNMNKLLEKMDKCVGIIPSRKNTLRNKAVAKTFIKTYERFNKGAY